MGTCILVVVGTHGVCLFQVSNALSFAGWGKNNNNNNKMFFLFVFFGFFLFLLFLAFG
jgi:hypothetical protein